MVSIVRCDYCSCELYIPIENAKDIIHVELKLKRAYPVCDSCGHWTKEEKISNFCSPKCFADYYLEGHFDASVEALK